MSTTTKQAVIEMTERLPDDASVEDIMAELYFRQKVDEGLRQLDPGKGIDHEEVKRRLDQWTVTRSHSTRPAAGTLSGS